MFFTAQVLGQTFPRLLCKAAAFAVTALVHLAPVSAHAEGDAAAGEKVFRKCMACHAIDPAAGNKVGPNLHNVIGHKAAMHEDYKYSPAMAEAGAAGLVWTEEELTKFLESPKALIKGTKMTFVGLKKPEERADVIAFIKSKSDPVTN
jgi:cytochrome c